MGADTSSSGGGGIALTSSNIDKIAVVHDGRGVMNVDGSNIGSGCASSMESLEQQAIAVGFAGDAADGKQANHIPFAKHEKFETLIISSYAVSIICLYHTADRLMGMLKTHAQVIEYEAGIGNDVSCVFDGKIETSKSEVNIGAISPAGLDAEAIANLSRNEIARRMRSRQPLQLCLLVGGMVRCNNNIGNALSEDAAVDRVQKQISTASAAYKSRGNTEASDEDDESSGLTAKTSELEQKPSNSFLAPKLFWLDQYGSLQNMRYAAHGFGSNFAYSVLDQRYRNNMSREEAIDLIQECFEQLRQRYVINSPQPPRIKCIDMFGVSETKRSA